MEERTGGVFAPGGPLAGAHPGYEERSGQRRMARAVAAALDDGTHLVIEAGTGTGKTLAYLVPALLSGHTVIVSTGTKALQEQLVEREVPVARRATKAPFRVEVLKGRANYLCLKKLEDSEEQGVLESAAEVPLWREIRSWSERTETGDRAELASLPDDSRLWRHVDGRAETCTGGECPHYDACFAFGARRRAAAARVVIVNHHLLFADLALRRAGHGRVLPDADALIVDEAHLVDDIASAHFGRRLSSRIVVELARDAARELGRAGRDDAPARALERAGRRLFRVVRPPGGRGRVRFEPPAPGSDARAATERLESELERLAAELDGPGQRADERALLRDRCRQSVETLLDLVLGESAERVVTVEPAGRDGAAIASWPIEVGPLLAEAMARAFETVVATSATLSVAGTLDRTVSRLGLDGARRKIVESPFSHAEQAALYVPRQFPDPRDPAYLERALREIEALLEASRGRALVLFASHRALGYARENLSRRGPWTVLVQGDAPREHLVERFREDVSSVLLGTASFRQGIDVPGEALRLVVVDKLPFAVPDDPRVAARARLIRARGGDAFREESLPEAILSLRQALGRLIRRRDDRGLLAVLDVRIRTRSYGRTVLASLPPWPLLEDIEQARPYLEGVSES